MKDRNNQTQIENEINHSRLIAECNPEAVWGWGTPAGRLRAKRRADLISANANLKTGMRVLEIGCGTGFFTEMFVKTGAQIIGVDISKELLEKARGRNLPEDRAKFLQARFEDFSFEEPFDAIIGSSVLHHLNIEVALARIYGLLKPGAVMSFAEPNLLNPQILIERKFRKYFSYVSLYESAFSRYFLASLLCRAGFRNIKVVPFDFLHPFTPDSWVKNIYKIGLFLEKVPLIREIAGSLSISAQK